MRDRKTRIKILANGMYYFLLSSGIIVCVILPFINDIVEVSTYRVEVYVDLNTGDLKYDRYIFDHQLKPQIQKTEFSKEVHKCGINSNEKRIWEFVKSKEYGLSVFADNMNGLYRQLPAALKKFKTSLDLHDIQDNERKCLIQETLSCIQYENPKNASKALNNITENLYSYK